MEIAAVLLYTLLILLSFLLIYKLTSPRHRLPPSPSTALPILGHLHLLKLPLHRTFHRLSRRTGPIFSLELGFRRCVVVSSPTLARECFSKHDVLFANRPRILIDRHIGDNHSTISASSYGEHWRSLRRVAAQEILSTARLDAFREIRQDEVNCLILSLRKECDGGFSKVELRPKLSTLTFNNMMRMLTGKRLSGDDKVSREVGKAINEVFELAIARNPQDFLPFMRWIDYGGFSKKLIALTAKLEVVLQSLVEEERRQRSNSMISHLLSLQESEPQFYSDLTIKGLIKSLLLGGTDTSAITMEWAMSLLLNHPQILQKAKEELDEKIGQHRLITEEDLQNLPYLQNIITETTRLFPAAPLLVPHESSSECTLGGYDIPKGTILFVNAWAIHRDPEVWQEAGRFDPERFEGAEVEAHKLLPFGMGRRACPGVALAQRMVGLGLGSMIQCFKWERVSSKEVDLAEGEGLTLPKLEPLEAICKPREIMKKLVFNED